MSDRPTHNIVASTNVAMNALALELPAAVHHDIMARWREAADRLAELDAEVKRLRTRLAELQPLDFRPDEERYERRTLT